MYITHLTFFLVLLVLSCLHDLDAFCFCNVWCEGHVPHSSLPVLECEWAMEDGRDGKGHLEMGTEFPKIIMRWETKMGLAMLSCYYLLLFSWLSLNCSDFIIICFLFQQSDVR